jgi:4-hydroxy-tetrahydrodipicolinate synthase
VAFEAQPGIGLAVRKEVLRRRGVIASAATRSGAEVDVVTAQELGDVLARVRLRPGPEPLEVED